MSSRRFLLDGSTTKKFGGNQDLQTAYYEALTQRLTPSQLAVGASKIFNNTNWNSKNVRLISTLKSMSESDVVRRNPTDPAKAAREMTTHVTFAGLGGSIPSRLFARVDVPFEMVETRENLEELDSAFLRLEHFYSDKIIAPNTESNPDWQDSTTRLYVARSGEETAELFRRLHPEADSEKYNEERTKKLLGFNVSTEKDPELAQVADRVLVVNPESLAVRGNSMENFGATPFEATVIHEYAHSLQKNISPNWGSDNDAATQAYKDIWDSDKGISNYANTEIREHFAENFARYVIKGEATTEFKEYLEKYAGIKPFNIDEFAHPTMGTSENLEGQLSQLLNSVPDSPVSFEFNISDPSRTIEDIQRQVANGEIPPKNNRREVSITLNAGDARVGNINTTFSIDKDGKLTVHAALFKIDAPELQGLGIADKVVMSIGGYVESIGGGDVVFGAGLDNGPYAWAMKNALFRDNSYDVPKHQGVVRRYLPLAEWWSENWQTFASLDDEQKIEVSKVMVGQMDASKIPTDAAAVAQDYIQQAREAYNRREIEFEDAETFLLAALQGGWTLSPADIDDMRRLLTTPDFELTPKSFAQIGRDSRGGESKAKRVISLGFGTRIWINQRKGKEIPVSSLGRVIMMTGGGWTGIMPIQGREN